MSSGPKNPLVHDAAVRQRFLDHIRSGSGRYEAAAAVGLSPDQFTYANKHSADFRKDLDDALDASVEPVIRMLRARAMDGDVKAAQEFLKHQAPPPRGAQSTVTHKVEIDLPGSLAELDPLIERLRLRAAATPALPYPHAIDIEETPDEMPTDTAEEPRLP